MISLWDKIPFIFSPNLAQNFIPWNKLQEFFGYDVLDFSEVMLIKTVVHTNPKLN